MQERNCSCPSVHRASKSSDLNSGTHTKAFLKEKRNLMGRSRRMWAKILMLLSLSFRLFHSLTVFCLKIPPFIASMTHKKFCSIFYLSHCFRGIAAYDNLLLALLNLHWVSLSYGLALFRPSLAVCLCSVTGRVMLSMFSQKYTNTSGKVVQDNVYSPGKQGLNLGEMLLHACTYLPPPPFPFSPFGLVIRGLQYKHIH